MRRLDLDTPTVVAMYTNGHHSVGKIAELLEVSYSAIYDRLVEAGVPRRPNVERRIQPPPGVELRRLYVDERLSLRQLENRLGAAAPTIRAWLKEAGIATRSISEAKKGQPAHRNSVAASVAARRKHFIDGKPDVGYKLADGYVLVLTPGHPDADASGYVREHRLVMERLIGRRLLPHEDVHHKNEVRHDNRPANLRLKTHADHLRDHVAERERDTRGRLL